MGAKYWSASNLAFYDSDITAVTAMPADKVALTDAEYTALIEAQTAGKKITHNSSTGKPQATDQGLTDATGTAVDTLDGKVVHKTGNETIAGTKTFTGEILTQHSITNAKNKSSADEFQSAMIFRDKQGQAFGHLQTASYADTGDVLVKLSAVTGLRKTTQDETTHYIGMGMRLDGTPYTTAPTPPANDDSTQIATTAWVGDNNAGSATKLATACTIDGVDFNGTAAITHYGTCSTAAGTAAKVVALTGFKLVTGARVIVRFTVTNTAASPTLNVNSTGAKAIQYRNAAITAGYLAANRVYEFVYDGSAYELIGDVDTNTTSYLPLAGGKMTGAIKAGVDALISHADDESAVRIDGGTTWGSGASLVLYGMSESSYKGQAKIRVTDGTNTKELIAKPDGTLTWGGAPVTTFPAGTQMLFAQSAAPTGWTKQTTVNDAAIRVVSGTTGGTASGTTAFSTMFNSSFTMSISGGNTGATTLTVNQMPSHRHNLAATLGSVNGSIENPFVHGSSDLTDSDAVQLAGGSGSHTHSLSGGSATVNLAVKYLDVIVCKKN